MNIKRITVAAGAATLCMMVPVTLTIASNETPKSLSNAEKISVSRSAYPALSAAPDGTPAPMGHPASAVANLKQDRGETVTLTATVDGQLCVASDDTTACDDAASAASSGVFIAAVDCATQTAHITGVLPTGADGVKAAGSTSAPVHPTTQGVVSFDAPIATVAGLTLTTGNTASLNLTGVCGPRPSE